MLAAVTALAKRFLAFIFVCLYMYGLLPSYFRSIL
jgi:hypothetical protein